MNDNELRNALENIEIEDYLGILKFGKLMKIIKPMNRIIASELRF